MNLLMFMFCVLTVQTGLVSPPAWSVRFSRVPLVCSHFFRHSRGQVGVQSAVKRPTSAAANVLSFVLISGRGMRRGKQKRIFYLCLCKCGMKKTEINELRAGDLQSPPFPLS